MTTKVLVLCLVALIHSISAQGNVEICLSDKGLNFAAGVAVDILARDLATKTIPNIDGGQLSLSNIRVTQFVKPSAKVNLNSGEGLTLSLSDASISAEADFSYVKKWWFIKIRDSGQVSASAKASISVSVKVGSDGNGKPTISTTDCSANLEDLNVKTRKTWASFLYNLLISLFKGTVRSKLQAIICDSVNTAINKKGAEQLATLNLEAKVNRHLTVDYSLARAPIFTSTYFQSYHKGKFIGDTVVDQVPSMTTSTDKMVAFSISDNVLNSALRVLYNKGVAKYTYTFNTWDDIAGDLPFNVSYGSGPFEVRVEANDVPTVMIAINSIRVNLSGVVQIISKTPGEPVKTLLTIQFVLTADASATIVSNFLRGSISNTIPSGVIVTPPIPNASNSVITECIEALMKLILPSINEVLTKGLPLPTVHGVSFIDSSLSLNARYLSASANVGYVP